MEETLTERLITLLKQSNATYSVMTHEATKTSEDSARVRGTALEQGAKALLLEGDGKPLLAVLQAHKKMNMRAFKNAFGIKNLRLVTPDEVLKLTGVEIGAVPPFGNLMNVPTYVDEGLLTISPIAFNAGSRTTSVILATTDFVRLVQPIITTFVEG